MSRNFFKKTKNKAGFTLVETMVAVGLFSIVMLVGLAIITSLIDNNKKAQAINSVTSNLNFTIDSMVRDIKTGRSYHCGEQFPFDEGDVDGCVNNTIAPYTNYIRLVSTLDSVDKYVKYEWVEPSGGVPGKIVKTSCLVANIGTGCQTGSTVSGDVTSTDIDITEMKFLVNPGIAGSEQPSVFLIIKGTSSINPTDASNFSIQTFISQRLLNI